MISEYGLKRKELKIVDIREVFVQSRPNSCVLHLFKDNNPLMINSPHAEFAKHYFNEGENWLKSNWKKTRYYQMLKFMNKTNYPKKFILLCQSISKGYLRKGNENNHITLLMDPFAHSRFNRDVSLEQVPEVWSGHHRIGALLALKKYEVQVEIAEDLLPGSCKSCGKIHNLCILQ